MKELVFKDVEIANALENDERFKDIGLGFYAVTAWLDEVQIDRSLIEFIEGLSKSNYYFTDNCMSKGTWMQLVLSDSLKSNGLVSKSPVICSAYHPK